MKKSIFAVAIAGALLAHTSTRAVEQAPPVVIPAPAKPVKSSFAETIAAAGKEIAAAMGDETDSAKRLAIFSKLEFSPGLRPKLKEVFGSEHIFQTQRTVGPKGQVAYIVKLVPHAYLDENAMAFSWAELNSRTEINKAGTTMNTRVTWPSLSIVGAATSGMLEKMSLDFKHQRGKDDLWYGNGVVKVGSVVVRGTAPGSSEFKETMRFEDISTGVGMAPRGKKIDLNYAFSIKSIVFGGDRIERANIGLRLVNLPAQAVADIDREMKNVQGSGLPDDAQQEVMLKSMKTFGKRMMTSGSSVVIDDISASYRGNTASIKGRVDFDKVVDADFNSPLELGKKIIARLDVRVPLAMVNDVSRAVGAKQVDASAPNAAEQIEAAGKNLAGIVIGKLVNEGFAVLDKGELRSAIEIKQGKLTFNGKVVPLPGMPDGDFVKTFSGTKKP